MAWSAKKTGNPGIPFVRFIVNDIDLLEKGAFRLNRFVFKREGGQGDGCQGELELFDKDWSFVEQELYKSIRKHASYGVAHWDYGYANGTARDSRSPLYTGTYTSVKERVSNEGVSIVIGFTASSIVQLAIKKNHVYSGMTISSIMREIAKQENFKEGNIVETAPYPGPGEANKTFIQANQTYKQFINANRLCELARTSDGKGPFLLYVEPCPGVSDYRGVLNFVPVDYDAGTNNVLLAEYIVYRDRMGDVIEWTPDLDMLGIWGGGGVAATTTTIDSNTKKVVSETTTFSDAIDSGKLQKGALKGHAQDLITVLHNSSPGGNISASEKERFCAVIPMPGASQEEVIRRHAGALNNARFYTGYSSQLRIVGDPTMVPLKCVRVALFNRDGVQHPSSGVWSIVSVEDSIDMRGFITTMGLQRLGSISGKEMFVNPTQDSVLLP
jgi:hypothetical protein